MAIGSVRPVADFEAESLHCYRTLRHSGEHWQRGLFVAEGEKVVPRLLESDLEVVSVLASKEWFERLKSALESRPESIAVEILNKAGIERLTGRTCYQPVKAIGRVPASVPLDQLLDRSQGPRLLVGLEGLSNADNVGAVVRNCAALGVAGVIADTTCSSPYLRRAVHASMGTVFQVPVLDSCALPEVLPEIRAAGFSVVAADPGEAAGRLGEVSWPEAVCLVLGSEGLGLSDKILAGCDQRVALPMAPGVDSLNVACASAVFLYEIQRRLPAIGRR